EILLAVGEDPNRPGLLETPKRVANMYEEIFAGLTEDPKQHIKLFDEVSNDEMVIVKDILFIQCASIIYYRFSVWHILATFRVIIKLSAFQNLQE
ncbi:GTP cyclohydrolase I, partial [human gut metagenome]